MTNRHGDPFPVARGMLERCAAEWGDTTVQALLDLSHTGESGRSFGVHDDRFLAPESMAAQVS
ncbi:MAG TPA: hypothetical protein VIT64_13655 [Ilumatobacteraceae bacterium]